MVSIIINEEIYLAFFTGMLVQTEQGLFDLDIEFFSQLLVFVSVLSVQQNVQNVMQQFTIVSQAPSFRT